MSISPALPASPSALLKLPLVGWLFSSIGKKTVVAVTGLALVLFVVGHLLGNFTIYFGPDVINAYALKLHSLGPLLWVVRLGLLAVVVLHIMFTMLVWAENRRARPQKYAVFAPMRTTVFARTMRLSGLIVLAFVIFHLAHFTAHLVDPAFASYKTDLHGKEVHDVYRMVVVGFANPLVSGFYVLALFLLAMHLSHGVSSLFQTLGVTNRLLRPLLETGARVLAWALFLGYASIPISIVVFGLGKDVLK
jgi:succinate dehydrogenase / fumarate reductase cytochrome b subunit